MSARFALGTLAASAVFFFASLAGTPPAVAEPGEQWETTIEMTMNAAGHSMTMPPQASKTCRPKGAAWEEPPAGPADSDCEMTDVKRVGHTMTWSMRCTNPPVTGKGSIEFQGSDSYRGTMSASTAQGEMSMKMTGKRIGDCDYSEQRGAGQKQARMPAEGAAASDAMVAQTCADGARGGMARYFVGEDAVCKGPQHKAAFCAGLATPDGYTGATGALALGIDIGRSAAFCGTDSDRLLAAVCQSALDTAALRFVLDRCPSMQGAVCGRALATEQFEFLLGGRCPAEASWLAAEQCAGRKYTAQIASKYGGFCVGYAQEEMQAQQEAQTAEGASPEKQAADKAKKRLKGLFGR
jgi:hypothetical protein